MLQRIDCEQFGYVLEGALVVSVEDERFSLVPGDVYRIPRNAAYEPSRSRRRPVYAA